MSLYFLSSRGTWNTCSEAVRKGRLRLSGTTKHHLPAAPRPEGAQRAAGRERWTGGCLLERGAPPRRKTGGAGGKSQLGGWAEEGGRTQLGKLEVRCGGWAGRREGWGPVGTAGCGRSLSPPCSAGRILTGDSGAKGGSRATNSILVWGWNPQADWAHLPTGRMAGGTPKHSWSWVSGVRWHLTSRARHQRHRARSLAGPPLREAEKRTSGDPESQEKRERLQDCGTEAARTVWVGGSRDEKQKGPPLLGVVCVPARVRVCLCAGVCVRARTGVSGD